MESQQILENEEEDMTKEEEQEAICTLTECFVKLTKRISELFCCILKF